MLDDHFALELGGKTIHQTQSEGGGAQRFQIHRQAHAVIRDGQLYRTRVCPPHGNFDIAGAAIGEGMFHRVGRQFDNRLATGNGLIAIQSNILDIDSH